MRKLYLVSQDVNNDYDTVDSMVVCALSEQQARYINPMGHYEWFEDQWYFKFSDGTKQPQGRNGDGTWCDPNFVKIKEIGEANEETSIGVILYSFNAG